MPYAFIEIEKQKKWVIRAILFFLTLFYFIVAEALWVITKLFFFFHFEPAFYKPLPVFSLREAAVVFLIASLAALIHWYFSTNNMVSRILSLLGAADLDQKDSYHCVLKNVIDEVSVATGGISMRGCVVPIIALNAFAISDFKGEAVIGVTEGLLAKLKRSQLEAVIAHEAAHIASGDSLTTTIACSLYGVYSVLLENISKVLRGTKDSRGRGDSRAVIYLIAVYLFLSVTKLISFLFNMFLSRQKEYRADAVAVRLTRNPVSLAEVLYIVSRGWRGVGGISDSLSPLFIMNPDYSNLEEAEGFISDLFSTHPPTKRRLEILLDMAHCDISALKESIKPKEKIAVLQGIVKIRQEPRKEWLIYKDNSWQGPFELDELFNQGLSPNSLISKLGEKFIKYASEDKDLSCAFRDKLKNTPQLDKENCPECKQPLAEVLYEGAPLLKCHYCEGIFANSGVISRILAREDFAFDPSIGESAEGILKSSKYILRQGYFKVAYELNCPKCHAKMLRGFFSYAYPIEVDRCERCQCVWFHKDKLEILQYLSEKFRGIYS